jgi:hypothetical protein
MEGFLKKDPKSAAPNNCIIVEEEATSATEEMDDVLF